MATELPALLPGIDWGALASDEMSEADVTTLHKFTGEGLLARDPEKYRAVVRGIFHEGIGVCALARLLHVSPSTIYAIEERELRLHPELADVARRAASVSLGLALKRGAEAAARAFLQPGLSPVEIAKAMSLLHSMSVPAQSDEAKKTAAGRKDDAADSYLDAIDAEPVVSNGSDREECFARVDSVGDGSAADASVAPDDGSAADSSVVGSSVHNPVHTVQQNAKSPSNQGFDDSVANSVAKSGGSSVDSSGRSASTGPAGPSDSIALTGDSPASDSVDAGQQGAGGYPGAPARAPWK